MKDTDIVIVVLVAIGIAMAALLVARNQPDSFFFWWGIFGLVALGAVAKDGVSR